MPRSWPHTHSVSPSHRTGRALFSLPAPCPHTPTASGWLRALAFLPVPPPQCSKDPSSIFLPLSLPALSASSLNPGGRSLHLPSHCSHLQQAPSSPAYLSPPPPAGIPSPGGLRLFSKASPGS